MNNLILISFIFVVSMNQINEVKIDSDGCLNLSLIKLAVNCQSEAWVRGYGWAKYHGLK